MALLPVADALARLLDGVETGEAEWVAIDDCADRVLAQDIAALRTQPPFDASAMDGYAVRATDATLRAKLRIIGQAPAGKQFSGVVGEGEAVRIFTGAPMPQGADSIVIQEDAQATGDTVVINEAATLGRHIRLRGLDFKEGDLLLRAGRFLDPAALSLAASANHPQLPVVRKPLVALIATGDELMPPGSKLQPDQIISSNPYGVAAVVRAAGGRAINLGIAADRPEAIRALVDKALDLKADVIVTLGGASVGDHDLVHSVLTDAGMALAFWKIAMRPGKPLMFGKIGDTRCIGLPGNPVASLLCAHLFLQPLVARLGGRTDSQHTVSARLTSALAANDHRQDYVRASVGQDGDTLAATPYRVQDSSMLRALAESNAVIVRPPYDPAKEAGDSCQALILR